MPVDPPAVPEPDDRDEASILQLSSVLRQRFDVFGLYRLRACVAAYAAELEVPANLASDIVLAVHELATNAVRHGPGCGRLRMWISEQTLVCEVADGGLGLGPDLTWPAVAMPGNGELPWPVEPGHGLWLVCQVAERLAVRHDYSGAIVTITFRI